MRYSEITEDRAPAPEHIDEALWWVCRYVTGSLNDPDWDWGEPTHLNVTQAMEIVGRYVGNQSSVGKPLYRYLKLSKPKAMELQQTMTLMPRKLGFQSFTEHGEEALQIGRDIHPDSKLDTLVCAEVPPDQVMFGMSDLKRASRLPGVSDLYMQLEDWHHQGEVIVRVSGPLKLIDVQISKPN